MTDFSVKNSSIVMGIPSIFGKVSQGAYKKMGSRFLPGLASFVLVVILAYQLAGITWNVFKGEGTGDKGRSASKSPPVTQAKNPRRGGVVNELVNMHLFGVPAQKIVAKPMQRKELPKVAPNTSLNLTLFGIFTDAKPELASAIIGKDANSQRYYLVGDVVSKGVTLEEVREDHVILAINGTYETLRFPNMKGVPGKSSTFQATSKQGNGTTPGSQPQSLSSYAEEIRNEPLKIMEYLNFVPVKEKDGESLKGFRVSSKKDRNFFNKIGLNSSDIIISVNGVSLTGKNPQLPELINQVSTASQIDLQVLRRGKVKSITLDLGS